MVGIVLLGPGCIESLVQLLDSKPSLDGQLMIIMASTDQWCLGVLRAAVANRTPIMATALFLSLWYASFFLVSSSTSSLSIVFCSSARASSFFRTNCSGNGS